jgi:hypothetical protein
MTLRPFVPSRSLITATCFWVAAAAALGQSPIQRDWAKAPAIARVDAAQDIFAIGDVHGDFKRLAKLLAAAKIVDSVATGSDQPHWIAGKSVVVFTGDLIDKGPDGLAAIALIRAVREDAKRAGGQVIVLMGNHEAEFLASPDSKKVRDFAAELKAAGINPKDVAGCRGELGQFFCSMAFAARVGDWFFSHAGNSGGRTLDKLDSALQTGVDRDGFKTAEITGENSLLEARLGDKGPGGASWFEAERPQRDGQQLLANYASALGAAHIVEGHQPGGVQFTDGARRKRGEMFQWRGLLFLIDTGMSRGVGDSQGAVLHIDTQAGQATAICPTGKLQLIWDAKQASASGSAKPCSK